MRPEGVPDPQGPPTGEVQFPSCGQGLSDLKWEPLISDNGRLGPVDDLGEGQLPSRAEKHRDAASLGGKGVTGKPSPTMQTLTPLPVPSWQLLLLDARGNEERKWVFGEGGELLCQGVGEYGYRHIQIPARRSRQLTAPSHGLGPGPARSGVWRDRGGGCPSWGGTCRAWRKCKASGRRPGMRQKVALGSIAPG